MLLDEVIHAARIGFKDSARCRIDETEIAFGGATETERAELFVDIDGGRTEDFGKLPAPDAPQQIHLPEPILRHDVALRFGHVFDGTRANVRDAPVIALDDYVLLQTGKINVAVELRQRAINETPKNGAAITTTMQIRTSRTRSRDRKRAPAGVAKIRV